MGKWRARGGYGVKGVTVEIERDKACSLDLSAESEDTAKAMI
jgi:hypothetical protein